MFSVFWPIKLVFSLFRFFLNMAIFLTCLLSLLSMTAESSWPFSLSVHFKPIYCIILGIGLLLILLDAGFSTGSKKGHGLFRLFSRMETLVSLGVVGFFLACNVLSVLPYWSFPKNKKDFARGELAVAKTPLPKLSKQAARPLKLLHLNLQGGRNRNIDSIQTLIQHEKPDLIDFVEYEPPWPVLLSQAGILKAYPYQLQRPGGIILLSKNPIKLAQKKFRLPKNNPDNASIQARSLLASVQVNHQPVTVFVMHPLPPVTPKLARIQQEAFEAVQSNLSHLDPNQRLVMVGDLNTTPWEKHFQLLTKPNALTDTQHLTGYSPTWPVIIPLPFSTTSIPVWPLLHQAIGLSLDHVLVGQGIEVLQRSVGERVGSDHLPVIVSFLPKTAT
ncbi:MAG: endonuclease/exonuclease/phosphatase family protein [Cyanobacteria bacterium P01_H01_bin.74]